MTNIYLTDLAHDYFEISQKTIPLGIGFLASYSKEQLKERDDLYFKLFRTPTPLLEICEQKPPDVIGFSCYVWNFNLSKAIAKHLKKKFPDCVIVMGGACIPANEEENKKFLKDNPYIDYLVFYEGEIPFHNVIKKVLAYKDHNHSFDTFKKEAIEGTRTLYKDELKVGAPVPLIRELDEIPSPYLSGLFDELLKNPILVPMIQKTRGCPYRCVFCVSGMQPGKLRSFSFGRIIDEIQYLKENAVNRILRFTDDNMGIIPDDLEVAQYVRQCYEKDGYPAAVKLYQAKVTNDRTRAIALELKPLSLLCTSFETTTEAVKKNSRRVNTSFDQARKDISFAREHGIATGTEIIFGLPGESLSSIKDVIDTMIELRFNSVNLNAVTILPAAEMDTEKMRSDFKYKTKFMIGENAITSVDGIFAVETDELTVESITYTYSEWLNFIKYKFIFKISMFFSYSKNIVYHAVTSGVACRDIYDEIILDHPEKYPILNNSAQAYADKHDENLFDSHEEVEQHVKKHLKEWTQSNDGMTNLNASRMIYTFVVDLIFKDKNKNVLNEFANAIVAVYAGENKTEFEKITYQMLDLDKSQIVNPTETPTNAAATKEYESNYDIVAWERNGYSKPLSNYQLDGPHKFLLKVRNPRGIKDIVEMDLKSAEENCFTFFRYLNSSQYRRTVEPQFAEVLTT